MPGTTGKDERNNVIALLDIQYLPCIPYFTAWIKYDNILLESHENFVKQTYRNRCRILTANGIEDLVIPLKRPHRHTPITEIRIDNRQPWPARHWKAIQSAYGKAPWFGHFKDELRENLQSEKQYLAEFNLTIIELCLKFLGIRKKPGMTEKYYKNPPGNYVDLRSEIHPKKKMENLTFYNPVKYIQNFGRDFIGSLSVIDLIFSEGPESFNVLKKTLNSENNHKLN